jgi:hypothetical protein
MVSHHTRCRDIPNQHLTDCYFGKDALEKLFSINKGVVHDVPPSDYPNTKQEYQHDYLSVIRKAP